MEWEIRQQAQMALITKMPKHQHKLIKMLVDRCVPDYKTKSGVWVFELPDPDPSGVYHFVLVHQKTNRYKVV